ncbi:uncharacterized protein LOC108744807 isoform X1 [Agrilus planipennis]|uniref:Uncharacterized protein LOC108744807 isoform X1 n=1 Tax=Agrilus planipennis TaxID=224129 RepID=A0A1W4XJS1_AGRPL|nr:uncharacterized protein LOC108744807 isoform X1 [Agrilus planipennis]
MDNFSKLLEEESESINSSLEKIEQEVDSLYHRKNNTDEETHAALSILEKISDTETALNEMLEQVERENVYLSKKTDETRADLKTMSKLVDDIEKTLAVKCSSSTDTKTESSPDVFFNKKDVVSTIKQEEDSRDLSTCLDDLEEEISSLYEN